ncbi:MAG: hemolysin III family protein [Eggerthellaceae bacterium]|nr:hemolysin III family protein [Eggerthellaceae bacterium]
MLQAQSQGQGQGHVQRAKARRRFNIFEYRTGEEVANAVSHGVGALAAIAALVILVFAALAHSSGIYLFTALVYGVTMLLEYTMSTLYHALTAEKAKRVFKVLDHSFIYLFIAGTYTPFCLITLADSGGLWLGAAVWALALAGVACEAFWTFRPRWIAAALYLLLGWCVVWFVPTLVSQLPTEALVLLVVGGALYTVGCVFYVLKKVPYMHSVFHIFVLAGSVCHFFSVVLYVL